MAVAFGFVTMLCFSSPWHANAVPQRVRGEARQRQADGPKDLAPGHGSAMLQEVSLIEAFASQRGRLPSLSSLMGKGKQDVQEDEQPPLSDHAKEAYAKGNSGKRDSTSAPLCGLCTRIVEMQMEEEDNTGFFCRGNDELGAQQSVRAKAAGRFARLGSQSTTPRRRTRGFPSPQCVEALLGVYWWMDSFAYWRTYGCQVSFPRDSRLHIARCCLSGWTGRAKPGKLPPLCSHAGGLAEPAHRPGGQEVGQAMPSARDVWLDDEPQR